MALGSQSRPWLLLLVSLLVVSSPKARVTYRSEVVLENPIRHAQSLGSGDMVRVAVMNSDIHARVDDLVLCLRKAGKEARVLYRMRVRGGHLKIQFIAAEE